MNVNLQVSCTQDRPHSQYLFYLVPQENLTTKQDWLLHPDYGQVRRLTCNLLVNLIKTNRITWYWSGGKQTNSLELEKPFLKLSINPKQILLPSSPYYKYPQETSHWTLCFFAPTTHVRVFERQESKVFCAPTLLGYHQTLLIASFVKRAFNALDSVARPWWYQASMPWWYQQASMPSSVNTSHL